MVAKNMVKPRGLVVFDLDGTLLRGPTVCELLAAPLGRYDEMRAFESLHAEQDIAQARVEMAHWYNGISRGSLLKPLEAAQWAPGALDGVARLREAGGWPLHRSHGASGSTGSRHGSECLGPSGLDSAKTEQSTMFGPGIKLRGYEHFHRNSPCLTSTRLRSATHPEIWTCFTRLRCGSSWGFPRLLDWNAFTSLMATS